MGGFDSLSKWGFVFLSVKVFWGRQCIFWAHFLAIGFVEKLSRSGDYKLA